MCISAIAQPGSLDPLFNPYDDGTYGDGFGILSSPTSILTDEQGRLIVGGGTGSYNEDYWRSVIRILPDGALDETFNCGSGAYALNPGSGPINSGSVSCLARTMTGQIYAGGYFTSFSGQPYTNLVRLEPDGAVDTTFSCTGATNSIHTLDIDAAGRIVVGGLFGSICGDPSPGLARLLPDGSFDTSFVVGTGFNGPVRHLAVQGDGRILAWGSFALYNGDTVPPLLRLSSDGSLDTTFQVDFDTTPFIECIRPLPNGDVVVAGYAMSIGGQLTGPIIRLDSTGGLLPNWSISDPLYSHTVHDIEKLVDGRFLIAGYYQSNGWVQYLRILDPFGQVDTTLYLSSEHGIIDITFADNKIAGIGFFDSYAGIAWGNIFMAEANGAPDLAFNPGGGASAPSTVYDSFLQPDGAIVIGGWFKRYNGVTRRGVAKLTPDGMLDATFDPGEGMHSSHWSQVRTVAPGADDKIMVGGEFESFDNAPYESLVCLNSDGTIDTTFVNIIGEGGALPIEVNDILPLPDGSFLVGGNFNSYTSEEGCDIVKILAGGILDPSFSAGTGFTSLNNNSLHNNGTHVNEMLLQADGRILVAGHFSKYNGIVRRCIARILPTGALDGSFVPDDFAAYEAHAIALQSDGKILVGGDFTTWTGPQVPPLVRLFPNGDLDTTFLYPPGYDNVVELYVDALDRIYVSTAYSSSCKRLNPDGSPDPSWSVGQAVVYHFTPQQDKMLVCGNFSSYHGTPRHGIARLNNDFTTYTPDAMSKPAPGIYPVPTRDIITLNRDASWIGAEITLADMQGRAVLRTTLLEQQMQLDVSSLIPGIYALQLQKHGKFWSSRFIKE